MSLFNSCHLAYYRKAPGRYVAGYWVSGVAMTPVPFTGTVQPASGTTLQVLPEGKRVGDIQELISGTELIAADPETQMEGDQVAWNGRMYEVTLAAAFLNGILPHYEYLITRIKEGQE